MSDIKKVKKVVARLDASDLRCIEEMKKMGVVFGRKEGGVPFCSLEGGAVWCFYKMIGVGFNVGIWDVLFWYELFSRCFREEFKNGEEEG